MVCMAREFYLRVEAERRKRKRTETALKDREAAQTGGVKREAMVCMARYFI